MLHAVSVSSEKRYVAEKFRLLARYNFFFGFFWQCNTRAKSCHSERVQYIINTSVLNSR